MQPLSLYIHMPWCIQKCPYCDFNSHKSPNTLPEQDYLFALLEDLQTDLAFYPFSSIQSIFIGGGTPSLFSAESYHFLLSALKKHLVFSPDIEITMEANPGSVDQQRFHEYHHAGINRLSLGIQSFNEQHLKKLGRVHDAKQAHQAIETARKAGFSNLNLDLMHGLPNQSIAEGLVDLKTALNYNPEHLSWYQLTIEPNTVFYKVKPALPNEDEAFLLEEQGFHMLEEAGYERYEISAFAKKNKQARHNLNYWLFGDYFGIGAGAHGKLTLGTTVHRTRKHRLPKEYLAKKTAYLVHLEQVEKAELLFEFMLNTTRLQQAIPLSLLTERTGLETQLLLPKLQKAEEKGLIHLTTNTWQVSALGRRYTNNLQELFLP